MGCGRYALGNLVEQELNVIGPRDDIERFRAMAVLEVSRQDRLRGELPQFMFSQVCPVRPDDDREAGLEPECGDLFRVVHSHTQVNFSIDTDKRCPFHFYTVRLLRDWPSLSFCCAINEEMRWHGGLIAGIDGAVTDLVWDYQPVYHRRIHARRIRALNKRWTRVARDGRPFEVWLPVRIRDRVRYDADATFDQTGIELFLRTEADCRRLLRGHRAPVAES